MQDDILMIDGVEYLHHELIALSRQSPTITIETSQILTAGIDIREKTLKDQTEFEINTVYRFGEICVFKYFNEFVLLSGYDKYLKLLESGQKSSPVKLLSKPVLKKARLEKTIKPKVMVKALSQHPRFRRQASSHDHLAQEDHTAIKPSRVRKIG